MLRSPSSLANKQNGLRVNMMESQNIFAAEITWFITNWMGMIAINRWSPLFDGESIWRTFETFESLECFKSIDKQVGKGKYFRRSDGSCLFLNAFKYFWSPRVLLSMSLKNHFEYFRIALNPSSDRVSSTLSWIHRIVQFGAQILNRNCSSESEQCWASKMLLDRVSVKTFQWELHQKKVEF